jgi:hypothetical protein
MPQLEAGGPAMDCPRALSHGCIILALRYCPTVSNVNTTTFTRSYPPLLHCLTCRVMSFRLGLRIGLEPQSGLQHQRGIPNRIPRGEVLSLLLQRAPTRAPGDFGTVFVWWAVFQCHTHQRRSIRGRE